MKLSIMLAALVALADLELLDFEVTFGGGGWAKVQVWAK
jgi:hypothetical protein